MASRRSTGNKMKPKGPKPRRASASAKPPAPLRASGGLAAIAPKPPAQPSQQPENNIKNALQDVHEETKNSVSDSGSDAAVDGIPPLKKQELIAQVVARSDVTKKHAKPVIEAMLAVLGEAIAEGREMNLQPMGKFKRKRVTDTAKARVTIASIRQPVGAAAGSAVVPDPEGGLKPAPAPRAAQEVGGAPSVPKVGTPPRHPLKEAVAEGDD